ncbi:MAG: folate family ECF transporter S component [Oscillospiraceae bacterium]
MGKISDFFSKEKFKKADDLPRQTKSKALTRETVVADGETKLGKIGKKLYNEDAFTRLKLAVGELKSVHSLCGTSMLAALNVVLSFTTVFVSSILRVGIASITVGVSGLLFGPLLTGIVGVAADLIKYFLRPDGPYFIGFAINEFLIGFIYGMFFYRKKISLPRTIAARGVHTLLINILLTPIWLGIMYHVPFWANFIPRVLKNIAMFPIDVLALYMMLKLIERISIGVPFLQKNLR